MTRKAIDEGSFALAGDLPDINVWLALAVKEHLHHMPAMRYWLNEAAAPVCFCRVTMLGLVRLLSQPKVMGASALSLQAAMQAFQGWLELPGVRWVDEPAECSRTLTDVVAQGLAPRLWTDAYLAAFARSANLRVISFDADFRRFDHLALLHLQEN